MTSTFPRCVLAAIYPLLLQKMRRANYLLGLSQVPFRHWTCLTIPVNAQQPSEVAASPIPVFQMGTVPEKLPECGPESAQPPACALLSATTICDPPHPPFLQKRQEARRKVSE